MKRIGSLLLAMVMAFSLLSVAQAEEVNSGVEGGSTQEVKVEVEGVAGDAATKYAVTITWSNQDPMEFTYNFAETSKTWNPGTHAVDTTLGGNPGWNKTSDTVTIVNHSNANIWVDAYFAAGAETEKVTKNMNNVTATLYTGTNTSVEFNGTAIEIPSAVGKSLSNDEDMAELTKAFTVGITDAAPGQRSDFKIDDLQIKIYNANPAIP